MRMPRASIFGLMIFISVIALNTFAVRTLFQANPRVCLGLILSGLTLQWAVFRLVRGVEFRRAFWWGFAVADVLAMACFLWGMRLPTQVISVVSPGRPPRMVNVSTVSALWLNYGSFVGRYLEPWVTRLLPDFGPNSALGLILGAIVWALPQLAAALAGGVAVVALRRGFGSRSNGMAIGPDSLTRRDSRKGEAPAEPGPDGSAGASHSPNPDTGADRGMTLANRPAPLLSALRPL